MRVFVSHNIADKAVARTLAKALRSRRATVWFDEWSIRPGESIAGGIDVGLAEADALVVVWSTHAASSHWVSTEWRSFVSSKVSTGDVRIVPILLDDTPLPPLLMDRKGFRYDELAGVDGVAEELVELRPTEVTDLMGGWLDRIERLHDRGWQFRNTIGLWALSEAMGGVEEGDVVAVTGPADCGRTALLLTMARNAAAHGYPSLVVTLGMTEQAAINLVMCAEAGVPVRDSNRATLDEDCWNRIAEAIGRIGDTPLRFLSTRPNDPSALERLAAGLSPAVKDHMGRPLFPVLLIDDGHLMPWLDEGWDELKRIATTSGCAIVVSRPSNEATARLTHAAIDIHVDIARPGLTIDAVMETELLELSVRSKTRGSGGMVTALLTPDTAGIHMPRPASD